MARRTDPEAAAQIAEAVKRTRKRRELSTGALGKMIGAGSRTIWNIEEGGGLSVAMLFELARVLECSWTDLLGPVPGIPDGEGDWNAGYRAGVGDALVSVRGLMERNGDGS